MAGRQHRFVWLAATLLAAGNGPQQSIIRYDTATQQVEEWNNGKRYFVDEPTFVPRHDDGTGVQAWHAGIVCA